MEKLSFKGLMTRYTVVIPMLQRDYAYGRISESEKRENFLKNIKNYLDSSLTHELDFIYGSVDSENILKLLDGQQRITTLFLLHWYLSLIKDETGKHHFTDFQQMMLSAKNESKFLYKTRYSASDFCNALVRLESSGIDYVEKYANLIDKGNVSISELIQNEKWFLPHWRYDPTIFGMLNMLDSMHAVFVPQNSRNHFTSLFTDERTVFNFLNLDDYELTDELYIKMNSRGRPLTRFENLKSKMLKLYDEASKFNPSKTNSYLDKINSTYSKGVKYNNIRDYVSHMIDGKWTDVFWNEWLSHSNNKSEPRIDDMMLSFMSVLAIFDHIIYKLDGEKSVSRKDALTIEINRLMSQKSEEKGVSINYEKWIELLKENDYSLLFHIIDYFNMFNDNGKLKTYLPSSFTLYSEKEAFSNLVNDYMYDKDMGYEKKAKLFAYVKYLSLNPSPDINHFESWMRFICNICSNSYQLPNYTDTFCTALIGINDLYDEDIVSTAKNKNTDLPYLDKLQIEEEVLKIKLSQNVNWKLAIDEAEKKLSYFEGRLRFPLIVCAEVNENDLRNSTKISTFNNYVNKIGAIFPSKEGCDCEINLIRALLSKGNYLLYFNSNNSLLQNFGRDASWRRFMKDEVVKDQNGRRNYAYHPFGDSFDKRLYFKQIIDDPQYDMNDVSGSLDRIACARNNSIPEWRKLMIDYLPLISNDNNSHIGTNRFVRWNDDVTEFEHRKDTEDNYEIDLIPGSAITGYHSELFSLCLYYHLQQGFINPEIIKYQKARTSIEQPYCYMEKNGKEFVKIYYQDDNSFRFVYLDGTKEEGLPFNQICNKLKLL